MIQKKKYARKMNFSFDGPDFAIPSAKESTLKLYFYLPEEKGFLYAWSSPLESIKGAMKYNNKEAIVTANLNSYYEDGDFYEFYDGETYGKAIFKITRSGREGYAVYIDDYTTMTTYQFNYVETYYDDERALKVANSIEPWHVTVAEETKEDINQDSDSTETLN